MDRNRYTDGILLTELSTDKLTGRSVEDASISKRHSRKSACVSDRDAISWIHGNEKGKWHSATKLVCIYAIVPWRKRCFADLRSSCCPTTSNFLFYCFNKTVNCFIVMHMSVNYWFTTH